MSDTADAPAGSITFDDVEVPSSALTLEGFRLWYATQEARGLQASWVRGRVYVEMSPQSYKRHQPIVQAASPTVSSCAGGRSRQGGSG